MKTKIPKDLTKELLTLILDNGKEDCMQQIVQKIVKIERNELHYTFKWDNEHMKNIMPFPTSINVDTLCREMKEWMIKQGALDVISGIEDGEDYVCSVMHYDLDRFTKWFRDNTSEFEAVEKAFIWVATEKSLI